METNRKHLTPRQILNRYRKGRYTDDCADNISAVVSSSDEDFRNTAIPIQYCWPETIIRNIGLAFRAMDNPSGAEEILSPVTDNVARNMLMDLANSGLLKCLIEKGDFLTRLKEANLKDKYSFYDAIGIVSDLCFDYKNTLESHGIDHIDFSIAMIYMIKSEKKR